MVSRTPRRWVLAVVVGSLLSGASASADPGTASTAGAGAKASTAAARDGREAQAEAAFREGSASFDAGHVDEACAAFARSLYLYPKLSTLLNLALCQEMQGKLASAWRGFTEAAAWASDPSLRDRRDFANQHALKLQRSLGRLEIRLPEGLDPSLTIDGGEPVAGDHLLGPIFVDPGEHTVEATAPGRARYSTTVAVSATPAEPTVVTIPLLPAEAAAPSARAPAPSSSHPSARRMAGFVVAGIGLLAAGLGGYFAGDALSKTSALAHACPGGCDPDAARASELASVMALGAGVAAVGTGAWLVAGAPSDPPAPATVVIAPRIGAGGGQLWLRVAW